MIKSPFLNQLLSTGKVPSNHPFQRLYEDDPILPAVDYFLSLTDIPGYAEKLKDYLERSSAAPISNEASKQWASICAEVGAIRLLDHELGLPIAAFERPSPRGNGRKTCDVVVRLGSVEVFCEVKRNSKEESQLLPEALVDAIENLRLPYGTTVELIERGYDCSDLADLLTAIERHVANCVNSVISPSSGRKVPLPYRDSRVEVFFNDRIERVEGGQYFEPATLQDVCSFLIESGRVGRGGKPMIPMVEQANEKGADYLVCRVPVWSGWYNLDKIAKTCFADLGTQTGPIYRSRDPQLKGLIGVILFARYDTYVVVNNEGVDRGFRIEASAA